MAHEDIEVEIKIKLTKRKFLRIEKLLRKRTQFVKKSHHIDDYYTPILDSFLDKKYPYEWLMLRKRDGKIKLSYKHWYPPNTKYTTHCDEYQTQVSDRNQMAKILKALRFRKFITIDKKRNIYKYKDELEIAMDEVKVLGFFIEVESLRNLGGIEKTRKNILEFTKSLGLTETKTVPGGYGFQMMKKKGRPTKTL